MTLPGSIQDREYQKFREAADGLPAVAMIIEQDESTTFLQSLGFAGSVGVVDNANGGTGALELLGKTFDKDILFDGATYSSVLGDFYLERINTAGTITWNIHESIATEDATPTANTESVFNLSALGTFTADQVLSLADLSITKIVSESWEDVSQAEVNIFAPVWQTAKMVGMEPAIAEKAVNRGGNLAYNDGNLLYRDGRTDETAQFNIIDGGLLVNDASNFINGDINGYIVPCEPNTEYTIVGDSSGANAQIIATEYDRKPSTILGTGSLGGGIKVDSGVEGVFTTQSTSKYLSIGFYTLVTSGAIAVGDFISNIQLNQGATANTYATPLNAPFVLGSRSTNKLKDGDAEMGGSQWAGVALISSNLSIVAFASNNVIQSYTARLTGPHTFVCRNLTSDAGTVQGILNSVTASAVAGNATPAYSVGSVDLVAGTAYDFEVRGSADDIQFDAMIIEGEYTQAEIADKGYIAFNPIAPLTCQANDGLSTVVDRIYGSGSEIYFLHNVSTVAGFKYGDPEIDVTNLITGVDVDWGTDQADSGDDATDIITFNGNYIWDMGAGATDISVATNVLQFSATSSSGGISIPITITSPKIHFILNVSAATGTWELTDHAGTILANITGAGLVSVDFTETIGAGRRIRLVNVTAGTISLDASAIDNAYNMFSIYENTAPSIENITAFGISGSLVQPMTEGQNHFVSAAGVGVGIEYSTSIVDLNISVRALALTKLDRTEQRLTYELKVVSTGGAAANSNTWVPFSDIAAMPDLVSAIKTLEEVLDTNIDSVDYYDNGAVINADATGTGAGDTLVQALVISGEPLIIHTIA